VPFHKLLIAVFLLCFCGVRLVAQQPVSEPSEVQLQIEQILDTPRVEIQGERVITQDALRVLYASEAYQALWTSDQKGGQLIALLGDAENYGLRPQDYHLALIEQLGPAGGTASTPADLAERDILMTDGLLLYSYHRRHGKVNAKELYPEFNFTPEPFSNEPPAEFIHKALDSSSLAAFIDATSPTAQYYELLRLQLKRYREIVARGGWTAVPEGPTLRRNDRDARVLALRKRLETTGELADTAGDGSEIFDDRLEQAVEEFQSLHGLDVDGVVGKQTIAELNVPAQDRVNQLRLSLERLRWVAQDAKGDFIAVNIAGFRISFVRDQSIAWTSRVMVGTSYRKTPVFRANMTYLEFNPTWTIPPTILRHDTLPAIRKDPAYLAENNITVIDAEGREVDPAGIDWMAYRNSVPFTLRQEPGPHNALGQVKFIFPNPYFVFMHDTPHRELFAKPQRTFSSGCIRVENPLELAELVLKENRNFTPARLQEILGSSRTQRVLLDKPIPVLILYLTASLDPSGKARFYRDIYQRDEAVLSLLDGPVLFDPL